MVEVIYGVVILLFLVFGYLLIRLAQSLFKIAALVTLILILGVALITLAFSSSFTSLNEQLEDAVIFVVDDDTISSGFYFSAPQNLFSREQLRTYDLTDLPDDSLFFLIEQDAVNLEELATLDVPLLLELLKKRAVTTNSAFAFPLRHLDKVPDFVGNFLIDRLATS